MLRFLPIRTADDSARNSWAPKRLTRAFRHSEDGQAIIELAIALPVLLIVVLGIVDFGRAVNYWNDENHVANLGARYAAVGSTGASCENRTYSELKAYLECEAKLDSPELANGSGGSTGTQGKLTVCVSIPNPVVGEPVTVKLTTKYSWLPEPTVLGTQFKVAETSLSGTAQMRLEQKPPSGVATTTGSC